MSPEHPLKLAIDLVGLTSLARGLGVTHQAVQKWKVAGRMPRTEWTGETAHCAGIERLTASRVTRDMLLAPWPDLQRRAQQQAASVEAASPVPGRSAEAEHAA